MTIAKFFTTTATVNTPSGASSTDSEGVPTVTLTSTTVSIHVQPYGANDTETVLGQDEAQRARIAWLPLATSITAKSSVVVGSDTYEVRGDPKVWNVGSNMDHISAVLVRVV